MTIVPGYYKNFKCIAGACKHTCCAGWEIDIDPESLARYQKDGIPNINLQGTPHFEMDKNLQCCFLRPDGLCRLIIEHGEGYLCQICKDHPRFRNFWSGITEVGLGLSCEETAKLILFAKTPMKLEILGDEGSKDMQLTLSSLPEDEKYLWNLRSELFSQAAALPDPLQARLAEYLIYRYIPDALYDGLLNERIAFVWNCVNEVTDLWDASEDQSDGTLLEIARKWSEKTEYNTELIAKKIK